MNKLIRRNDSGKRGLGLALAAVALVAVLVVGGGLTAPRTAEAQTLTSSRVDVPPQFTFSLTFSDTSSLNANGGDWVNFRILPSSTATGRFLAAGGRSALACRDKSPTVESACDDDTQPQRVVVVINVPEDSPNGPLVIQAGKVGGSASATVVVNVTDSLFPAKFTMSAAPLSIATTSTLGVTSSTLTLKVSNANGVAVARQPVRLSTTLGTMTCGAATGRQACVMQSTAAAGGFTVTLNSTAKAGIATITATSTVDTSLTQTVNIIIYGPPAKITLAPDQETIAQGGVTFVLATVTDAGGNPVTGARPTAPASAIVGPTTTAVKVSVQDNVPRTAPPPTVPACNQGTSPKGQCVFRVSGQQPPVPTTTVTPTPTPTPTATPTSTPTPSPTRTARDLNGSNGGVFAAQTPPVKLATRGPHMITVSAAATVKATTTITVGGPPKTIRTDAPMRVKALSETRITITVTDDANVRVGAVIIAIDRIEGEGKITTGATFAAIPATATTAAKPASMTSDGRYTFTFLAPRDGRAGFLISVGAGSAQISAPLVILIGDAPPPRTWSGTPTPGWNNLTWEGEDGAAVADNIGPNVTAVYRWNVAAQRWDAYFPSASGAPGNDFTTLTQGATYWVFSR